MGGYFQLANPQQRAPAPQGDLPIERLCGHGVLSGGVDRFSVVTLGELVSPKVILAPNK